MKNDFTFGFEIEGLFKKELVLNHILPLTKKKIKVQLQNDGSVHLNTSSPNWVNNIDHLDLSNDVNRKYLFHSRHNPLREIALGTFKGLEEMLTVLGLFKNDDNYLRNSDCGLHIHIKPKKSRTQKAKELRRKIESFNLIQVSQQWATQNLCQCTENRIYSNRFCKFYPDLEDTFHDIKTKYRRGTDNFILYKKYRFLHFHPSGTFEFRFFPTCTDKEKNVRKFFEFFLKQLENRPKKTETLTWPLTRTELFHPFYHLHISKQYTQKKMKINLDKLIDPNTFSRDPLDEIRHRNFWGI